MEYSVRGLKTLPSPPILVNLIARARPSLYTAPSSARPWRVEAIEEIEVGLGDDDVYLTRTALSESVLWIRCWLGFHNIVARAI